MNKELISLSEKSFIFTYFPKLHLDEYIKRLNELRKKRKRKRGKMKE